MMVSVYVILVLLGCAMFYYFTTPWLRNYETNKGLDIAIQECLGSGIESVSCSDTYNTTVKFNNGYTIQFWTANRMYAYASQGFVLKPDGTKTYWANQMPSRWTNRKLEKAVAPKSFL
ncbi:hypothetical protein [Robertmurraya sp.]|uniref:hypothetical protein n=1 Tax=Robertmurraya sp. TaxID=2837525 RepID=UPI0037040717